ncbi:unnamed protein product [Spirodela intermedia]|uniref:Uncharacterized protein n=1 Tax=Spirodela intermedia TaxID=51605 RepID=A0A7I8IT10_SPIIN|nr:unnamed protein product [Spirodela intermedia]CAA6660922.1 unnamed protein product [Spirodela intermedia]
MDEQALGRTERSEIQPPPAPLRSPARRAGGRGRREGEDPRGRSPYVYKYIYIYIHIYTHI